MRIQLQLFLWNVLLYSRSDHFWLNPRPVLAFRRSCVRLLEAKQRWYEMERFEISQGRESFKIRLKSSKLIKAAFLWISWEFSIKTQRKCVWVGLNSSYKVERRVNRWCCLLFKNNLYHTYTESSHTLTVICSRVQSEQFNAHHTSMPP